MTRVIRALAPLALLLVLVSWAPAQADQAAEIVARITVVEGGALVVRGSERLEAEAGLAIEREDEVVTSARGRMRLNFRDGTVVAIGPNSRVLVLHYLAAPADGSGRGPVLELIIGILRATVPSAGSLGWSVETRAAVASSRSTDWIVEAGAQRTSVLVLAGRVEVYRRAGGRLLLTGGEGVDVTAHAPLPDVPNRWGAARVIDFVQRTRVE